MTALVFLLLCLQGSPDVAVTLREKAVDQLKADRLESAQVLLSVAQWLKPSVELEELEKETVRKLRESKTLVRGALDMSAITDSIYDGLVARISGPSLTARTAKRSSLTLTIDGEQIVIRGTSVARTRKHPGEIESDRIIVVTDDETLLIAGHSLKVVERKAPGALAGRLLASKDAKEQAAGAMLYSIRGTIRALEALNDQRLASGVAPVAYSAELSEACRLHACYLANEEPENVLALAMHEERAGSPFRTEEGAAAGKKSCVTRYNLECAVGPLLATLYHRVPMMASDLARVGIAQAEKDFTYYSVIDVMSDHDKTLDRPVMVPGDGQTRVPLRFTMSETPDPRPPGAFNVGYPITLSWYGDDVATAVLKGPSGVEVACWISTPKVPANATRPDNASSVCLLPKRPLARATKYGVTITEGEKVWSWSFTTK